MKHINAYSVAVYSAQKCTLFDHTDVDKILCSSPQRQSPPPDPPQLDVMQESLVMSGFSLNKRSKIVVVVPDSWISVSQHRIDHIIPTPLAPLAALSYAVETTFSMPETLMFYYQQVVLEGKNTQLTVFACSSEWAAQLCSPFQSVGASCLLMSQTQWPDLTARNLSWSFLRKHALAVYQPDKEKCKKVKRLWLLLALFSLLIHSGAYSCFLNLEQVSQTAILDHKKAVMLNSEWEFDQNSVPFVESVLTLVQALPISVRLVQFETGVDSVFIQATLTQQELISLIDRWQQENGSWRFEWKPISQDSSAGLGKEVMDASISVFKS